MSNQLSLAGRLDAGLDARCASACGGDARMSFLLALRCTAAYFQSIVASPVPLRVQTAGAVGSAFVDLDMLGDLSAIEFLYAKSDQPMVLRIGAEEASVLGVGGTFPTTFAGGETLTLTIDGTAVSVAFLVGDQTAAQCVARINAACALAGLPTPRASVVGTQIQIDGVATGVDGEVTITGGTGAATLGLTGLSDTGGGADVRVFGSFLAEFDPYPNAPARVQVSGQGNLTVVAAGRSSV